MSYNDSIAGQFHTTNVIQFIVETLRNMPKEKIIRIGTAILAVSGMLGIVGWIDFADVFGLEYFQQGRE